MTKGYITRTQGSESSDLFYIFYEGETEKVYLRNFQNHDTRIKLIYCDNTDPLGITAFAVRKIEEDGFDEGDVAWCVFDAGTKNQKELSNAYSQAKNNNIRIAISNPCIELWFLLHFKDIRKQQTTKSCLSVLKCHIKNYSKGKDCYNKLIRNQKIAIIRAKRLNNRIMRYKIKPYTQNANPCTHVYKLIKEIYEFFGKKI